MTQNQNSGRAPDFRGDGVGVWVNVDKNGKKYLSIMLLGNIRINAFKYEPQQKQQQETSTNEVNMSRKMNNEGRSI